MAKYKGKKENRVNALKISAQEILKSIQKHPVLYAALAATIAAPTYVIASNIAKKDKVNSYIVATVKDLPDDSFNGAIPAQNDKKETVLIPADSIVLVDGEKVTEKGNTVMFVDQIGEAHTGQVDGKYLNDFFNITEEELSAYNNVYIVKPEEGAYLRNTPSFSNERNKVSELDGGEIVLGGIPIATAENEYFWIPVLCVEKGINIGYVRSDLVELQVTNVFSLNEKQQDFIVPENFAVMYSNNKEDGSKIMKVDMQNNGESTLKLRKTASRDGEIIQEISDGSIVHVYEEDLDDKVIKNGCTWVKVHYIIYTAEMEIKEDIVGYADENYLKETLVADIEQNEEEVVYAVESGAGSTYFRKGANENTTVLLSLQNGYKIKTTEEQINSALKNGENTWLKVNIHGNDGYVNINDFKKLEKEQIMEEPETDREPQEEITYYYSVNDKGRITGVDADGQNYNKRDSISLLTDGIIDKKSEGALGEIDTSFFGKPSFTVVKIGHVRENQEFSISDEGYNPELVEASKETGTVFIPYMYASVKTVEEADKTSDYILNMMNSIEDCPNTIVIDYENDTRTGGEMYYPEDYYSLSEVEKDTIQQINIYENTRAVSHLCNTLKEQGKNVILYTSGKATYGGDRDMILDLDQFYQATKIGDLWITAPDQEEIGLGINGEYLERIGALRNFRIIMTQDVLDTFITVNSGTENEKTVKLDIDTMSEEDFKNMVIEGTDKKVNFVKVPNKEKEIITDEFERD